MTDRIIQGLASLECAYRALTAASNEFPLGCDLVSAAIELREKVRDMELKAMEMALCAKAKEGGAE